MKARETLLKSDAFGEHLKSLFPIIEHGGSDSGAFDNVLEFLAMDGRRSIPEGIYIYIKTVWFGVSDV